MQQANAQQMNLGEIFKRMQKLPTAIQKMKKDDVKEVLDEYVKLQVVYMD